MRRTILLTAAICAFLLLLSSCGEPAATNNATNKPANAANNATAAAPATNAAAIETEIKKGIDEMSAALSKNDAAAMEKMFTDTYRFVGPDGAVATGPERIASMKSGDTKFESITFDEVSVRSNPEGNGAVSIARVTVKGTNLGSPVNGQNRVTYVWSKTKDGWRLASAHVSEIKAPAKPANANSSAANTNAAATK